MGQLKQTTSLLIAQVQMTSNESPYFSARNKKAARSKWVQAKRH